MAAFVLHELRYLSWLGDESSHPRGHGSDVLLAVMAIVVALALTGIFAGALFRVGRRHACAPASLLRLKALWPVASGTLLTLYSGQELLHGALEPDHPFGVHGLFGHGGWIVVPLALLLGGIVALVVGVARELERRSMWIPSSWFSVLAPAEVVRIMAAPLILSQPLAENLSGRSPPRLAV